MYPGNSIITALQNFFHYNEESKEIKTQHTKSKKRMLTSIRHTKYARIFSQNTSCSQQTQTVILTNDIVFYFQLVEMFLGHFYPSPPTEN